MKVDNFISCLLGAVIFSINVTVQAQNKGSPIIGIDPDIINRILNEPEHVETVDSEVEKYPKFRKCRDDSGRLLFITPLLNVIKNEDFMTTSGNRFLDADTLNREITLNMRRQGISDQELCDDMHNKMKKVEEDPEYDYWSLMDDLVACTSACGKVLATMGSVYMATSAKKFSGLVLFNFDSDRLEVDLAGDYTQAYMKYDNAKILDDVYQTWKENQPKSRIAMDARASLPGSADYNDGLSRNRVNAVRKWFVNKGVPASHIDFKWLGKYGPPIENEIAGAYGIGDLYEVYEEKNAKQSSALVGEQAVRIYDGLNQSVALFVYE